MTTRLLDGWPRYQPGCSAHLGHRSEVEHRWQCGPRLQQALVIHAEQVLMITFSPTHAPGDNAPSDYHTAAPIVTWLLPPPRMKGSFPERSQLFFDQRRTKPQPGLAIAKPRITYLNSPFAKGTHCSWPSEYPASQNSDPLAIRVTHRPKKPRFCIALAAEDIGTTRGVAEAPRSPVSASSWPRCSFTTSSGQSANDPRKSHLDEPAAPCQKHDPAHDQPDSQDAVPPADRLSEHEDSR